MAQRFERMNQVAEQGNIDEFYNLIRDDVKLLEDINEIPFVDTPLHIAALKGHTLFAMEMMRLKPSFAKKLNPDGLSPIHLALQRGNTQMVCRLLQVDRDLVRVKGKEGNTPLHYVAGPNVDVDLLAKFLLVCPDSIKDLTIRNETALHIALKCNNLEAFKVLVTWLVRNNSKDASFYENTIPNWKDEEGNTVLHIAVSKNQIQAVSQLLTWAPRVFRVNIKNLEDKTAWDILQEQTQVNREMEVKLRHAKALTASSLPTVTSYADYLKQPEVKFGRFRTICGREMIIIPEEKRNAFLVVTVLLITVTYQAVLSPPGGLWQDDYKPETNQTTAAHEAGTSIVLTKSGYPLFLIFNTMTFFSSSIITCLLLPDEYSPLIFAILGYLWICYIESLRVITNGPVSEFNFAGTLLLACIPRLMRFNVWIRTRPLASSEHELLQG